MLKKNVRKDLVSEGLIQIFIVLFGLCIGSFLNVCIYRLPASRSLARPRSSCPKCGYMIRFYDNIPVISFLILRARCRKCGYPISFRYPLIEMLTGFLALSVYLKFGLTVEAIVYFIFLSSLVVVTFIDIDHQIIPNRISLPGIPIFFAASFLIPSVGFVESILGIVSGGGILFLVAWFYERVKKIEGMGFGDVKLLAMIGALVGWKGVLFTIASSSAAGTLTGVIIMVPKAISGIRSATRETGRDKTSPNFFKTVLKAKIPYGPFLALGAAIYVFFGPELIRWYFRL